MFNYIIIIGVIFLNCVQKNPIDEDSTIVVDLFIEKFQAYEDALIQKRSVEPRKLLRVVINDISKNQMIKDSRNSILQYIDSLKNEMKNKTFEENEKELLDKLLIDFENAELSYIKTLASFEDLMQNEYYKSGPSDNWDRPVLHYGNLDTLILEHNKTYTIPITVVWESYGTSGFTILRINNQDTLLDKIIIKTPEQTNKNRNYIFKVDAMNNITREAQRFSDTLIVTTR